MSVIKMYASGPIEPNTKLYVSLTSGCVGPHESGEFVGYSAPDAIVSEDGLVDVVVEGTVPDGVVYPGREICVSE